MTKRWVLGLAFFALGMALLGAQAVPAKVINYTGHYELADSKSDWDFALDVSQAGNKADVSFSASMADGSGAAPDADGKGQVGAGGALKFAFKDSFDNEGTATLAFGPDGYRLKFDVSKTVDPRPMRFYGLILLKKLSDKPSGL
jgi:hypothetical protein